jgi:hypothetical protein
VSTVLEEIPLLASPRWQQLRAAAAIAAAAVTGACLLWGLTYPGYPMDVAVVVLLGAVTSLVLAASWGSRARRAGRSRWGSAAVPAVVSLLLAAAAATAGLAGEAPLRVRWAASQEEFDSHVTALGAPGAGSGADGSGSFSPLASCPTMLGSYPISRCVALDQGYLFLQTGNPVTDDSGFAYLPGGTSPEAAGLDPDSMTPLGGPWWTWSCYC